MEFRLIRRENGSYHTLVLNILQTSYVQLQQQKRLKPSIGYQIFPNKHGRKQAGRVT